MFRGPPKLTQDQLGLAPALAEPLALAPADSATPLRDAEAEPLAEPEVAASPREVEAELDASPEAEPETEAEFTVDTAP